MKKSVHGYAVLLTVAVAMATGCGSGPKEVLYNDQVEGTVKLDDLPLGGVIVMFVPDTADGNAVQASSGITDDAGQYKLKVDNGNSGAAIIKHKVILTRGPGANSEHQGAQNVARRRADAKSGLGSADKRPVPSVYSAATHPRLFVDVTAEKHTGYDLNIKSTDQ